MSTNKFFEKPELDETYAMALERQLISVWKNESVREWRMMVWPMIAFGLLLVSLGVVLGIYLMTKP